KNAWTNSHGYPMQRLSRPKGLLQCNALRVVGKYHRRYNISSGYFRERVGCSVCFVDRPAHRVPYDNSGKTSSGKSRSLDPPDDFGLSISISPAMTSTLVRSIPFLSVYLRCAKRPSI